MKLVTCMAIAMFAMTTGIAHAADASGCKDDPTIKRYEGAEIVLCKQKAFEQYRLMTGKISDYNLDTKQPTFESAITTEGPLSQLVYRIKKGPSALEVYRNYADAMKEAGFELVFEADQTSIDVRNGDQAGYYFGEPKYGPGDQILAYSPNNLRYGAFRKKGDDEMSVALFIVEYQDGYTGNVVMEKDDIAVRLDVARPKAMKKAMVQVSASEISKALSNDGKVSIYGILFDFNKSDIKPESKPALDEIAKYLTDNPDAKLLVVGHTDNVGGRDFNQKLSEARAESVVNALRDDYGVKSKRLSSGGAGLLAPVASNQTEEGRAKNRRVELIPE